MKNQERVRAALTEATEQIDGHDVIGVAASDLQEILGLQRNIISHLLNKLVSEGVALKINTRPVYFLTSEVYWSCPERFEKANHLMQWQEKVTLENLPLENTPLDNIPEETFDSMIGANGSLKDIVEQCKSAVQYPPNGLPMLLVGSSGVGKSYLAQKIAAYGQTTGVVSPEAPFIVFNCAEYANNAELLTAALFGYCKGAFTGADKDKTGVIEEANGGFLFLDEIHRLSSEGQEKLFHFLDKGIFRRLGESGVWREASVRLICATTESPEHCFLPTFLRRIPLLIKIPSFQERPLKEKLQLIQCFYHREAVCLDRDLIISSQVVHLLVKSKTSGNIGRLTNAIKLSCANVFKGKESQLETTESGNALKIKMADLPTDYLDQFEGLLTDHLGFEEMRVLRRLPFYFALAAKGCERIQTSATTLENLWLSTDVPSTEGKRLDMFLPEALTHLNHFVDDLIFSEGTGRKPHDRIKEGIEKAVGLSLQQAQISYGLKWSGNSVEVLGQLITAFQDYPLEYDHPAMTLREALWHGFAKEWQVAVRLIESVEKTLDMTLHPLIQMYVLLYLKSLNRTLASDRIYGVIVAHGYATASSIASVANRILGDYVFDAFDMPLEMTAVEMGQKLSAHIETLDTAKGIVILVDMGSLEGLYRGIDQEFFGDMAMINNVSTQLALDVGHKILQRLTVEEIAKTAVADAHCKYHFRPAEKVKQQAILTTCSTGIGTASKIKELLERCFANEHLKIIAHDYERLAEDGRRDFLFKQYDVRLIIGTMNPQLEGIPFVSLESLIMQQDSDVLHRVLEDLTGLQSMADFHRDILRLFTLENVVNYLTILNPDKIIDQVDKSLNHLEKLLNVTLMNDHRISLTIHICCMVERLVMKDPLHLSERFIHFGQQQEGFVRQLKKAFESIESFYRVDIPLAEMGVIHENLRSRVTL